MIKTLVTSRLTIRPLQQTDAGALFQLYKDQSPGQLTGFEPFKNLEAAGKQIAGLIGMNKTGLSYHWAVELTDQKRFIGVCNIYLPAPHQIGLRCCEVSYGLLEAYRRLGYMQETLLACLKFALEQEGFYRVEASVSPTNETSCRLLERLGFIKEGLQRKKWPSGRSRHDMLAYALLADELKQ